MNDVTRFLLGIDQLAARSFLHSQARLSQVAIDMLRSRSRGLSRVFEPVGGSVGGTSHVVDEVAIKRGLRSNSAAQRSLSYTLDNVPWEFHEIIQLHKADIVAYLGEHFLYEPPLVFRTLNFPQEFWTYDVYSNVWHQDSHDGNRLLKIFVLLQQVDDEDGPMYYLPESSVRRHWDQLSERWNFEKMRAVPEFAEAQRLTGPKGSYLILDTSRIMHRASIPKTQRDMMQLTLFPNWRTAASRHNYASA